MLYNPFSSILCSLSTIKYHSHTSSQYDENKSKILVLLWINSRGWLYPMPVIKAESRATNRQNNPITCRRKRNSLITGYSIKVHISCCTRIGTRWDDGYVPPPIDLTRCELMLFNNKYTNANHNASHRVSSISLQRYKVNSSSFPLY